MTQSILIVDDDPRIRTSLAQVLAAGDTEVRAAEDGERAIAAMAARVPDLVLADVRMPGLGLPTVASAMREGALDFLVKPVDLHRLRALVTRIFDDRRTRSRASRP
jgi:two-component system, OmpR family, response regulator